MSTVHRSKDIAGSGRVGSQRAGSVPGLADTVTARWPRLGLIALLTCTGALYLWRLSATGYGNAFYAAAAQAGAQSWSAWFFGALDAGGFITVDKPPVSLWVTGLSVRLFGMHPLSVLVPQALMGVAAVAALYATVRRVVADPRQGAVAGLVAGTVLACTPAAALMFRFNDPDALLVLLLTVAAYCLTRAVHAASWRWLLLVGLVLGTAFLTKMLQAFLVLPGFGLAYLLFAPTTWRNRLLHATGAVAALVVAAGWWVLVVQSIPSDARPYVGGSRNDSVLDLAFGYNGLDRLVGRDSEVGGPTMRALSVSTGLRRLFSGEMGNEISWLLPVALLALAFSGYLVARGRLSRDERAAAVAWGGWLLVTGGVFTYMHGTVHPYYTVALAPAVAALVGLGGVWTWRQAAGWDGRLALAAALLLGGFWPAVLLHRNHFGPNVLPWVLAVTGSAAAVAVVVGSRRLLDAGLVVGTSAALVGTAAFTFATAATPHHGAVPNAVGVTVATSTRTDAAKSVAAGIAIASWTGDEGTNGDLAALLAATSTPWSAATNGSQSAAALEIASHTSVMAIGGWSGDPTPTLAQFMDDVRAGKITYYVEAGRGGTAAPHGKVVRSENHGTSYSREIADWVAAHFRPTTIGTSLVYRLN
jgi:4-amino-4-deoxy-L-arabinose transferase-like glycosyltransferase